MLYLEFIILAESMLKSINLDRFILITETFNYLHIFQTHYRRSFYL